jgi:hypothetical protein
VASLQPIADGFIRRIKMLLSRIIFGTIVVGIARMNNLKEVGRIRRQVPDLFRDRRDVGARDRPRRDELDRKRRYDDCHRQWDDASQDNRASVATH